jgi:hypothetical protein
MKAGLLLTGLLLINSLAWSQPAVVAARDEEWGQALAAELRNSEPAEDSEVRGVLKVRSSRQRITNDIPVVCRINTSGITNGWEVIYETTATARVPAEKLVVRRHQDRSSDYFYAKAASPDGKLPEPRPLKIDEANVPLAGSDFWLTDLGLEFLHWPQQRRLKDDMRLGRSVDVLESLNLNGNGLTRVQSSIDKETGGILIAEAYDAKGKLVKEFTLSGSSFKKVNGRWQLKRMEIRNAETGSKTTLEFDLPKKEP